MKEQPQGMKQDLDPVATELQTDLVRHRQFREGLKKGDPRAQFFGDLAHLHGNWFSKLDCRDLADILLERSGWRFSSLKRYTEPPFKFFRFSDESVALYPALGRPLNELTDGINAIIKEIVESGKSREESPELIKKLSKQVNTLYAYACRDWNGKLYIPGSDVAPETLKE